MRRFALPPPRRRALAGCGSVDEATPAAGGNGKLATLVVTVDDDGARGAAKPPRAAAGLREADRQPGLRRRGRRLGRRPRSPPGRHGLHAALRRPEEATIKGTIRGNAVDATFSRTDGCEIARWERVEALLAEVP